VGTEFPTALKTKLLSELEVMATSDAVPGHNRAQAALTVSECYTLGFGSNHDSKATAEWLLKAALQGSYKSSLWYHRICLAVGGEPITHERLLCGQLIEECLISTPTTSYLISRIHFVANSKWQQVVRAVKTADKDWSTDPTQPLIFDLHIFNSWDLDDILPFHFVAWSGDDCEVHEMLQSIDPHALSQQRLTAVHYACLGGRLSTLKVLIDKKLSASVKAFFDITPLHLCIFFHQDDTVDAVNLLLQNGADPEAATTSTVYWEDHDIRLSGTALDWAVLTRNLTAVKALLPHSAGRGCLQHAMRHFFWDIAEYILQYLRKNGEDIHGLPTWGILDRPFSHWIAHGCDHMEAIHRTIGVAQQFNLSEIHPEGYTYLDVAISNAAVEANFHMLEGLISKSSSTVIKGPDEASSPLLRAMALSRDSPVWEGALEGLLKHYSTKELDDGFGMLGSYLHYAVSYVSTIATRVLLKRGVNVNKPSNVLGITALNMCMSSKASTSMYSLLVKHGAVLGTVGTRPPGVSQSSLELSLLGIQNSPPDLIELALAGEHQNSFYGETLHTILPLTICPGRSRQEDQKAAFRYILRADVMAGHLNDVNENGATLIQRAAFHLDLDSVRVLLEAGADASIPVTGSEPTTFPLQIACMEGSVFWANHELQLGATDHVEEGRKNAIEVAIELLEWHHARDDGLFTNITRLHLAACMGIVHEIDILRRTCNPVAKGKWPGVNHEVTAAELVSQSLGDWRAILEVCPYFRLEEELLTATASSEVDSGTMYAARERIRTILIADGEDATAAAQSSSRV
jgi:ankyrin repeat protein